MEENKEIKKEDEKKEKIQFAKIMCVVSIIIVGVTLGLNFILAYQEKTQMSDVTLAVVSTFGTFITVGYFTLSGVRDTSLNKYGKTNMINAEEMKQYAKIIKALKGESDYADYSDYPVYPNDTDYLNNTEDTLNNTEEEVSG